MCYTKNSEFYLQQIQKVIAFFQKLFYYVYVYIFIRKKEIFYELYGCASEYKMFYC